MTAISSPLLISPFDYKIYSAEAIYAVVMLVLVAFLVVNIFYLLTLQNTIKAIAPPNRTIRPGQVWLMLIPLFSIVWQFMMVGNIADSIRNEFRSKGQPVEDRPTYGIGLAMCILQCCFILPVIKIFAFPGSLVCWIIYWVKVNEYKNRMLNLPNAQTDSLIFGERNNL